MIRMEEVYKSFNGFEVLRGVSFEVERGEILALIGGSGNGKSVVLKHIVGLLRPDRGRVWIDHQEISRLKGEALEAIRSRIGFLFQSGALFTSMTVYENVAFPLREKTRMSEAEIRQRVMKQLQQVGLSGAEHKYPAELSGGMIKRTAFARALITEPQIMLFDEPTTGLDPIIAHTILDLIQSLHAELRFTAIIVSHELSRVFRIAHRVAMLHEGRIWTIGPPETLLASEDPVVRQFISGATSGSFKFY
ncbi:MAG: ABC transporter ATP-binding protein [Desulfobacterota bacterium]|nr:ABC transporter ATP-binding protein [Thermodesulfobacteriota bacterium]